ncbi:MAG: L-aspartate oxidase [Magnetococcales bacterium]|nr:L-aspartate oxidase [Magnetococcales bacterium]
MISSTDATSNLHIADVLVMGSGVAGLDAALRLAQYGDVIVLTKGAACESNSVHAQGGIAAVLDPGDRLENHIADTLEAGAGLCNEEAVQFVVEQGAEAIQHLIDDIGVSFTRNDQNNGYHLTREGGHSNRRVIHSADATGQEVVHSLLDRVRSHPRIHLYEHFFAIDLITARKMGHLVPGRRNRCYGCYALDPHEQMIHTFQARFTVLATGGAGKVYLYTSNPDTATGDGLAMAWRAGCRVANMEFFQFHPTCLYHPQAKSFLISEAVRGEGGRLLLKNGQSFMDRHHARMELAPRDIVARAIDFEMKRTGDDYVLLDISHKGADFIRAHFPNILEQCAALGIDMTREALPVVPAAHYLCGGVMTDLNGQTDIDNLYAIGEISHTGLHGANRLASNSLLECLVFSGSAARQIGSQLQHESYHQWPSIPMWDHFDTGPCEEAVLISHNWDEIRRCMWNYVGIVRSNQRLDRARRRLELLRQEIDNSYWNCRITRDLLELRNLATVAMLIVRAAIHRKESRGLHFTTNYPNRDDALASDTVLPVE